MAYVAVGGGLLIYFGVLDPILKALGVKDTKDTKDIDAGEKLDAFNPKFYQEVSAKKIPATYFTVKTASGIADNIWNAIDGMGTDEGAIFSAFKNIKTQVQLSQVSHRYALLHNSDLYDDLKSDLSESDMIRILDIVKKIPQYK